MTTQAARTRLSRGVFFLLSLLFSATIFLSAMPQVFADPVPTTLSGQVTGGQPPTALGGAVIDVLAQGTTTVVGSDTSDTSGEYSVVDLAPNTYDVRVTAPPNSGFEGTTLQNIDLTHNQLLNISLTPSGQAPTVYQYNYQGKLLMGGQPFETSNNSLSLQLTLTKTTGAFVAGPIETDASGNYSFTYYTTTETTAPDLQLVPHFSCRLSFCPDAHGGYSIMVPSNYTVTGQPQTFTTANRPLIDLPLTHLVFHVFDPSGNEITPYSSLETTTASGSYEIAPGVSANWSGGDTSRGFFDAGSNFNGYVIPGATYSFKVGGEGYYPVPVTIAATNGEMVQNVTVTEPVPVSYTYTYHGQVLLGGQPFETSNNTLGLQLTLTRENGAYVAGPIEADANGNYSFNYYTTTEPTAPDLQLVPHFSCRLSFCPDAHGGYSIKTPSNFRVTDADPVTFTTSNSPVLDVPLTHLTFDVVDPDGNHINSNAYLVTTTASGSFDLAPGVSANWSGGDESRGFFDAGGNFNGYVVPGATYTFQVTGEAYEPVTVTVTAVPGEMTRTVTATTLAPVYHEYVYHGKLLMGGQPFKTSNNVLGLQLTLFKSNGGFIAGPIETDANGDYNFSYYTTDTTAPVLNAVPRFTCRISSCPDANYGYSIMTPSNFTVTAHDPTTFTTDNRPVFDIPLTHITFHVVDTQGTPLEGGVYLDTETASGTLNLAPGLPADWSGGDTSRGFFDGGSYFYGYVIPGASYTFTVIGGQFLPVHVTLNAVPGEMTQTVVMQPPATHPPVVNTLAGGTIQEGGQYSESGTFTDSDSSTWTATADYGDGTGNQIVLTAGHGFILGHTYKNNGTYTVAVTVTDNQGLSGTATTTVTVTNAAPVIGTINGPTSAVRVNTATTVSASFTDAGVLDTHQATWNWGDGTSTAASITENNGSGSVSNTHTYTATGVYQVTLTVTDNDGAVTSKVFEYVNVYNPTPLGLFTAAALFQSPAGAVSGQPTVIGTVNFNVTARYNGTQPTGNVSFTLTPANIRMVSTGITLLVTGNGKATLRGTATVNGASGYTFLVTGASSGKKIRFQIKNPAGQVMYDSQPGAAVTALPTATVTGVVIVN